MGSSSEELAHSFPPFSGKNVAGNFPQTQLNGTHRRDESEADSAPPALPPKTRKPKDPPKETEISDRGDSDMDEDTHSSNQDKRKSVQVVSEISDPIRLT